MNINEEGSRGEPNKLEVGPTVLVPIISLCVDT